MRDVVKSFCKIAVAMLLFFMFSIVCGAQTPTQTKTYFAGGRTVHQITLDQPTQQGQALVVHIYYGCCGSWWPNPICALEPGWCNYTVSDSQGNSFVVLNTDYPALLYVPATKGGPETITVLFSQPSSLSIVATAWPVSLIAMDKNPARCNQLPMNGQQELCIPWVGATSNSNSDDTASPTSQPITTSVDNELLIGWGQCGTFCFYRFDPISGQSPIETFSAAPGWSAPLFGGEVFLAWGTAGPAGSQAAFSTIATPPLAEGQYMYTGINGFWVKPIAP
jgi:hypothetical protein